MLTPSPRSRSASGNVARSFIRIWARFPPECAGERRNTRYIMQSYRVAFALSAAGCRLRHWFTPRDASRPTFRSSAVSAHSDLGITKLVSARQQELLNGWIEAQLQSTNARPDLISRARLEEQSREFLQLFSRALDRNPSGDIRDSAWDDVRAFLEDLSRSRGTSGFSPSQTAAFVFSMKEPIFRAIRDTNGTAPEQQFEQVWKTTELIDRLGLFTTEVFQKGREQVIQRQQQEMLELSTPVVKLWDGVLALPMIGTLDSARTQVVMESLLQRIVETGAEVAIIDITGVPTVDTLVAQHLIKTVTAARLMGAECIISGIRPQIAQTIVHLGVDLGDVVTKATLADAFKLALSRVGLAVGRVRPAGASALTAAASSAD